MEFWGVEVKPGQNLKCEPGDERVLHLSQASLGESKKEKGNESVPIFVKINDQKLILGTLSSEKCAQIQYDLVFEKDFELSHGSKHTSVFFVGYRSVYQGNESEEEEFSDSDSEEDLQIAKKLNGILPKIEAGKSVPEKDNASGKVDNPSAKQKAKADTKENIKTDKVEDKDEDDSDDDQDGDSDEESEDDEDMVEAVGGDSSEEDDNESSDEEEGGNPKKVVGSGVKRSADSKQKTPVPEKKAKLVTPTGNQKAAGKDGKKAGGVHVATPYPSKKGEKPQQSPKSGGTGSVVCKTCNRTFNHENALQDHTKAKHGAAAAAK